LFIRKTKNDAKDSFLIAETIRIRRFSTTKLAEGKHHYTAIGTVARKLMMIVYAVLHDNNPYVPNC
jgi:hypothetical protein